jgi:hypothetical protein
MVPSVTSLRSYGSPPIINIGCTLVFGQTAASTKMNLEVSCQSVLCNRGIGHEKTRRHADALFGSSINLLTIPVRDGSASNLVVKLVEALVPSAALRSRFVVDNVQISPLFFEAA